MRQWYTNPRPDEVEGPFNVDQLKKLLQDKSIKHTTLVCLEGTEDWKPLYHFEEFDRRKLKRHQNQKQDVWFVVMEGQKKGPLETAVILKFLEEGKLKLSDQVLIDVDSTWVPLGVVEVFHQNHELKRLRPPEATKLSHISGKNIHSELARNINSSFLELAANIQQKPNKEFEGLEPESSSKMFFYGSLFVVAGLIFAVYEGGQGPEKTKAPASVVQTSSPAPSPAPKIEVPKPGPAKIELPKDSTVKSYQKSKPIITNLPKKSVTKPEESHASKSEDPGYRRYDPATPEEQLRKTRRKIKEPETDDEISSDEERYSDEPEDKPLKKKRRKPSSLDSYDEEESLDYND